MLIIAQLSSFANVIFLQAWGKLDKNLSNFYPSNFVISCMSVFLTLLVIYQCLQ